VDEGLELRQLGIGEEILVLQGAPAGCARLLYTERLTPVVADLASLEFLGQEASRCRISLSVHLKFDTGMGRLGLRPEEADAARAVLERLECIHLSGVTTHFARAGESASATAEQLARFRTALSVLAAGGMVLGQIHAANSAACLSDPASHFDFVRLGLSLYGVSPEPGLPLAPALSPVLTWVSEVEHLRMVPAGSPLSYGGTFVTRAPSRIAVIPVGYADGYRRALGNRGQVLIRGQRAPVVGRVTMDLALVDVTEVAGAERGDEVILLGSQGDQTLSATEMASWLDTISYEVLCCIGSRVPRVYGETG
jgi:alanine racemase